MRLTHQSVYSKHTPSVFCFAKSTVSLRLGHTRGKTIINRFLRPSCRFATSEMEACGASLVDVLCIGLIIYYSSGVTGDIYRNLIINNCERYFESTVGVFVYDAIFSIRFREGYL